MSVTIPKNFSDSFEYLITDPLRMSDEELESTRLRVSVDSTNVAVTYFIQSELLLAMMKFITNASIEIVGYDLADYFNMVKIEHKLRGDFDIKFDQYVIAGLLVVNVFACLLTNSCVQLLEDKRCSSFARIFVAGVTPSEFLIAQIINNLILTILVLVEVMFVAFYIMDYPFEGSYLVGYGLLLVVGAEGIAFGIMLGVILDTFVAVGVSSSTSSSLLYSLNSVSRNSKYCNYITVFQHKHRHASISRN